MPQQSLRETLLSKPNSSHSRPVAVLTSASIRQANLPKNPNMLGDRQCANLLAWILAVGRIPEQLSEVGASWLTNRQHLGMPTETPSDN